MTEEQWLQLPNLARILNYYPGQVSDRKLRLFVCACCRRKWDLLTDERSRRAVEMAERYVDGRASKTQLHRTFRDANAAILGEGRERSVAWMAAQAAIRPLDGLHGPAWIGGHFCDLIRDILGNPFRPVPVERSWLKWNKGAIANLARGIYEERTFEQMPILADALEDAGCGDRAILEHCRAAGAHARGCWLLDLLLGFSQ